jgi:hypothetical protein
MKRFLLAGTFFRCSPADLGGAISCKDLVACLLPSPRQVAVYLESAAVDGTLVKGDNRHDAPIAHRLHHWSCCGAAVGIADRALEGLQTRLERSPSVSRHCRVSAGSHLHCCGSDRRKPHAFRR